MRRIRPCAPVRSSRIIKIIFAPRERKIYMMRLMMVSVTIIFCAPLTRSVAFFLLFFLSQFASFMFNIAAYRVSHHHPPIFLSPQSSAPNRFCAAKPCVCSQLGFYAKYSTKNSFRQAHGIHKTINNVNDGSFAKEPKQHILEIKFSVAVVVIFVVVDDDGVDGSGADGMAAYDVLRHTV